MVNDKFLEFYNLLKIDRQKSDWSKKNTLKTRCGELNEEIQELLEAVIKNDLKNLKEELGDVLWDVLSLIVIAEDEKILNYEEVIDGAVAKLKRRKPWIFTGEDIDVEEEVRRWKETKKLEKEQGIR